VKPLMLIRLYPRGDAHGGETMTNAFKAICLTNGVRYTTRDALIGAGVMLAGSLFLAIIGIMLKQRGFSVAGEVVVTNGFFFSLVLSMPFWILKGQSRLAQIVLVGGMLLMLSAATYVAYQI
jgi:hypothetical protein